MSIPFHRNVDVSTIKELVRRWYAASAQALDKHKTHAVLDDIRESIEELRFYRRTIFRPQVL
jgi:oligoribonuclease